MSTQTTAHTMAIQASRKPSAFTLERFWLYLILCLFAFMFLMPIYVMLVNSIKPLDEIRAGNLVALPWPPPLSRGCRPGVRPKSACKRPASSPTS